MVAPKWKMPSWTDKVSAGAYNENMPDELDCIDPDCTVCNKDQPYMPKEMQTLIIIKPDAVRNKIISKVFKRLEATGLTLRGMKYKTLSETEAQCLYQEHKYEDFFPTLVEFMTSGPSIVMVWEGESAAARMRNIIGEKHPEDSAKGTIRGDLATSYPETVIHGSDPWSAKNEIPIFFKEEELV